MLTRQTSPPIPRLRGEKPLVGSLGRLRDDPWGLFLRVLHECGDVGQFHIGPLRCVQVNTAEHAHEILVEHHRDLGRGFLVRRTLATVIGKTLSTYEGEQHRHRRRVMAPVFQPKHVATFADTIVAECERMMAGWTGGDTIELTETIKRLSMRVSATVFMAASLPDDIDDLVAAADGIDGYLTHALSRVRPMPFAVPTGVNRRARRARGTVQATLRRIVDERRAARTPGDDLLGVLLDARNEDGSRLTTTQLVDELNNIFINFFPTTATVIWPLYLLATHPETLRALQDQADEVLGGRPPAHADLKRLPLAVQVYKEAMRVYPFVPDIMRVARRPFRLHNGYQIKTGDLLHVATYAIHRRPDYYPDPERFDPDRFSPDRERRLPRWGFIPFGLGPHVCIGNYFSLMQGPLLLAAITQRVNLELVPGQTVRPNAKVSMMLMPEQGMRMTVCPRDVPVAAISGEMGR